jgi:hypothetical protein
VLNFLRSGDRNVFALGCFTAKNGAHLPLDLEVNLQHLKGVGLLEIADSLLVPVIVLD